MENFIIHVIMRIVKNELSFRKSGSTCGKACFISFTEFLNSSLEWDEEIRLLKVLAIRHGIFPIVLIIG